MPEQPPAAPPPADENQIIAERRAKLRSWREAGDAYPNDFRRDAFAADLHQKYGTQPNEELEASALAVNVAGRMMLKRVMGRASFATIKDMTGRIQLYITNDGTGEAAHAAFKHWDMGDILGATGTLFRTKTGELSVRVTALRLLSKALRPLPEKYHGLLDTEAKVRQRYLDLITNDRSQDVFQKRSQIIQFIRQFFVARRYLEVETPMMHPIPGGAAARPFVTHHNALDLELFLRIAPELYLKRLVVGGFERVFEIGRVFRNEGISPRHNPEFTMLEIYAAYWDYEDQMQLTENVIAYLCEKLHGTTKIQYGDRELDLTVPWPRKTLSELTSTAIGVEVSIETPIEELRALCIKHGVEVKPGYGVGKLLLELYEKTVEHTLWGPVFVCDYPKEVSPLARDHRSIPNMTERFEGIVAGRELCNGYSELVDAAEQKARFEDQVRQSDYDDEAMVMDHDYVRALEYGLAPTGGLGIGIDRLVMLLTNMHTIRDVIAFPTLRPEVFAGAGAAKGSGDANAPELAIAPAQMPR